jgi:hypothetical protein
VKTSFQFEAGFGVDPDPLVQAAREAQGLPVEHPINKPARLTHTYDGLPFSPDSIRVEGPGMAAKISGLWIDSYEANSDPFGVFNIPTSIPLSSSENIVVMPNDIIYIELAVYSPGGVVITVQGHLVDPEEAWSLSRQVEIASRAVKKKK